MRQHGDIGNAPRAGTAVSFGVAFAVHAGGQSDQPGEAERVFAMAKGKEIEQARLAQVDRNLRVAISPSGHSQGAGVAVRSSADVFEPAIGAGNSPGLRGGNSDAQRSASAKVEVRLAPNRTKPSQQQNRQQQRSGFSLSDSAHTLPDLSPKSSPATSAKLAGTNIIQHDSARPREKVFRFSQMSSENTAITA